MVLIISGLITYLLLAIYCREEYNEKVSIKRVRELRIKIRNEAAQSENMPPDPVFNEHSVDRGIYATP